MVNDNGIGNGDRTRAIEKNVIGPRQLTDQAGRGAIGRAAPWGRRLGEESWNCEKQQGEDKRPMPKHQFPISPGTRNYVDIRH